VNKVTGLDVLMSELPSKLFLCSTWPDGMIINKKCFIAPLLLYILRAKKLNLGLSYWILLSLSKNHFFSRDRVIFTIFFFKIQTATNGRFMCYALRTSFVRHKNWSSFSETGRGQQKCLDKAVTLNTIVKHPALLLVHITSSLIDQVSWGRSFKTAVENGKWGISCSNSKTSFSVSLSPMEPSFLTKWPWK
jgi:hypothetical protein